MGMAEKKATPHCTTWRRYGVAIRQTRGKRQTVPTLAPAG
jgi:hypothetical protein